MSNMQIIPFNFESNQVSVIEKDGEPWFIANEVCQVLEIVNTSDAIKNLDEDEKGIAKIYTLEENRKY